MTPVLILMMAGLELGFGILISSLTTKYQDLRFWVQFGVQLLMYATSVMYPVSSIPERFQWIILANPMTSIVEAFHYAFLGAGSVNGPQLLYSFGFMVLVVGLVSRSSTAWSRRLWIQCSFSPQRTQRRTKEIFLDWGWETKDRFSYLGPLPQRFPKSREFDKELITLFPPKNNPAGLTCSGLRAGRVESVKCS